MGYNWKGRGGGWGGWRACRQRQAVWNGSAGVPPAAVRASRPPLSLRLRVRRFQIADQALKRFLIRMVILPVAEVGDEILANLAGGIFSGVGVEALPSRRVSKGDADGEQQAYNLLTCIY